jgi:hypothetical protein
MTPGEVDAVLEAQNYALPVAVIHGRAYGGADLIAGRYAKEEGGKSNV